MATVRILKTVAKTATKTTAFKAARKTTKPTKTYTKVKITKSYANSRKYNVYVSPIKWKGKLKFLGTAPSMAKAQQMVEQFAAAA